MGRHDHGSTVGHDCLYVASERSTRRTINTGERLIEQNETWIGGERACNFYTPAFTAR